MAEKDKTTKATGPVAFVVRANDGLVCVCPRTRLSESFQVETVGVSTWKVKTVQEAAKTCFAALGRAPKTVEPAYSTVFGMQLVAVFE